jgi:hypothetical protein
VTRALRLYFGFLTCAIVLSIAAVSTAGAAFSWRMELVQFALGAAAVGAAAATWATAIFIAYVHRVTWPFVVLTALVVVAGGGFAFWAHTNAQMALRFV